MVFGGEGFYDDFKGFNLILRFRDYDFWIQHALISLGGKFELIWRILIFFRGWWSGGPFWGCSVDFEISGLCSLDSACFN